MHDTADQMVAILPPSGHVQKKIDLGFCLSCLRHLTVSFHIFTYFHCTTFSSKNQVSRQNLRFSKFKKIFQKAIDKRIQIVYNNSRRQAGHPSGGVNARVAELADAHV